MSENYGTFLLLSTLGLAYHNKQWLVHIATATENKINLFSAATTMGFEPIHDGNGNDTKIMKIMLLPSQCERALNVVRDVYQLDLFIFLTKFYISQLT